MKNEHRTEITLVAATVTGRVVAAGGITREIIDGVRLFIGAIKRH